MLIGKTRFGMYEHPMNKIVQALLRPKADNNLSGPGWVMIDGIRATLRVVQSNDGANFSEDAESLMLSPQANPTSAKYMRDAGF